MITSLDVEKAFDKIQHIFMIKSKLGIKGNYFNLIKIIYKNPMVNIYLPVRLSKLSHQVQGKDVPPLLFNIILEFLANTRKTRKVNKRYTD